MLALLDGKNTFGNKVSAYFFLENVWLNSVMTKQLFINAWDPKKHASDTWTSIIPKNFN